jgi:NAD(P)-dependent dehydrogenase (short-subunit alcohol dehydrogenase family)
MVMNVLITGSAGGIGREIVSAFEAIGCSVLQVTRDDCDLSDATDLDRYLMSREFKVDVFVHCAGVNEPMGFESIDDSVLRRTMGVNYSSGLKILQKLLPYMRGNGFGRVVFISSLWSELGRSGRLTYSASKAALDASMRSLAVEYAKQNILFNSLAPGFVDTPLTRENMSQDQIELVKNKTPTAKLVGCDEIARMVVYLCGEANSSITGQSIKIDGGYSISGNF